MKLSRIFASRALFLGVIGAAAAGLSPVSAAPASIEGRWKVDDGTSIVTFYKCGAAMCGRIEEFLVPEPKGGARDSENPDAAKRDRKLKGLRIFWNLTADGDSWEGKGYTPKEGRYFNADLKRAGNKIEVKGCVAIFCRTLTWTRA